jgi:DNA polymerase sigma
MPGGVRGSGGDPAAYSIIASWLTSFQLNNGNILGGLANSKIIFLCIYFLNSISFLFFDIADMLFLAG